MILSKNCCTFEAGEYDVHLSDIVNMEASCSLHEDGNSSSEAMAGSLIDKVEMEHCFSDDLAVHSIPVNDATASQEELDDTELGSFFMEDDSNNAALPPEVLTVQSKARSRDLPTSKDLEKLEGIWKKVLCNLHYTTMFCLILSRFLQPTFM